MLKDTMKGLVTGVYNPVTVDPMKFNDPLAFKVSWMSLITAKSGGPSNKLTESRPGVLEYKPSFTGKLMGGIFVLIGLAVLALSVFGKVSTEGSIWPLRGIAVIFAGVGAIVFLQASKPVVFDKNQGRFYRGKKHAQDTENSRNSVRFEDIHALQLLSKLVTVRVKSGGGEHSYSHNRLVQEFELNLVDQSGERVNITSYINSAAARQDAQRIGDLINVPVWDGIDG